MKNQKAATFVCFLVLLFSVPCFGQQQAEEVVPMARGERAPVAGMLFPTELAIRMGFRVEQLELRLQADVDRVNQICSINREYDEQLLRIERERYDHDTRVLEDRIADQAVELAEPIPWYRTWGFGFGLGVGVSALFVVLTAVLVVYVG